jgi:hypothetical protein
MSPNKLVTAGDEAMSPSRLATVGVAASLVV